MNALFFLYAQIRTMYIRLDLFVPGCFTEIIGHEKFTIIRLYTSFFAEFFSQLTIIKKYLAKGLKRLNIKNAREGKLVVSHTLIKTFPAEL